MTRKVNGIYSGFVQSLTDCGAVAFFVAMVVLPCIRGYWPIEQAKMYVAAAENAIDKAKKPEDEKFQEARKLLGMARQKDPLIVQNLDYLRTLDRVDPIPMEQLLPALKYLSPSTQRALGIRMADDFLSRREFEKSYQILSQVYSFQADKTPEERNRLAYGAALARKDLRLARQEIDAALSGLDDEIPEYFDTKAWVLHELFENEEALIWIDRSIKKVTTDLLSNFNPNYKITEEQLEQFVAIPNSEDSSKSSLTISQVTNDGLSRVFKVLAIYHYHRAEILNALKEQEKADWAFDWLENRGFRKFTELF